MVHMAKFKKVSYNSYEAHVEKTNGSLCGEERGSNTLNLEKVTCPKCISALLGQNQKDFKSNEPQEGRSWGKMKY